ncbi:hypothetical protein ES703_124580 [subsurface metagenome]
MGFDAPVFVSGGRVVEDAVDTDGADCGGEVCGDGESLAGEPVGARASEVFDVGVDWLDIADGENIVGELLGACDLPPGGVDCEQDGFDVGVGHRHIDALAHVEGAGGGEAKPLEEPGDLFEDVAFDGDDGDAVHRGVADDAGRFGVGDCALGWRVGGECEAEEALEGDGLECPGARADVGQEG